jgi:hypothetical protein
MIYLKKKDRNHPDYGLAYIETLEDDEVKIYFQLFSVMVFFLNTDFYSFLVIHPTCQILDLS